MNRLDFTNRNAVVTGGAAGIGFAVAERLVQSGARVALWDRDGAALARAREALGGAAQVHEIDIARADAVERATDATASAFGRIDVLVCSAGITGPNVPTWEYPVDEWQRVFDVNVHGLFYCNRSLARHMRENDYGRIVNIASVAGKEGNPNAAAYSASKAAVIGLTKSLGKELARTGVRANCVTPAAVRTAIFDQMSQQHIDFMLSKIPLGRFGLVQEIAALVCWLASEECSFSTGAVFDASGGRATY
jgi:2-dehydro-3-deoxy-L-rhamnonate dehydrogenase (NAD+)